LPCVWLSVLIGEAGIIPEPSDVWGGFSPMLTRCLVKCA
jgi:hypothetical protein